MPEVSFDRPFQEDDYPYFLTHKKSLILYEPRMGKTPMTCRLIASDPKCKIVLINCSMNALSTWLSHLPAWWGAYRNSHMYIRYVHGTKGQRFLLWNKPIPDDCGCMVFISTYEAYNFDNDELRTLKFDKKVDTLVLDEMHRKLKNRNSKSHDVYKPLVRQVQRFHGLSGTMAGKWGPADFWGVLNLIDPSKFSSYWAFVDMFCIMEDTNWGRRIIATKNMEGFHMMMSMYSRIRLRAVEAPWMPKVTRELIWVEPTHAQARHLKEMGKSSFTFTASGAVVVAANSLEKHIRKRQFAICPAILDPTLGVGAAFIDLVDRLKEAREDEDVAGQHVVIFTTFRAAIPHFEAYLRSNGFSNIGILVGGTSPEEVDKVTEQFRSKRGIVLGTTQFAQAFSLAPATVCYHVGYDYDPNNNKQAEDRLVPQQGTTPIQSYYYAVHGSDDDDLGEVVTTKHWVTKETMEDPRPVVKHVHIELPEGTILPKPPALNTSVPLDIS